MFSEPRTPRIPPCVLFEDEHLLVANKPAGLNTHAPDPFAGEGLYDWLKHREPRWAALAIIHRLDKETSGVIVFARTALANRSLTGQFMRREVRKKYLLLTDRPLKRREFVVKSKLIRAGERYVSGSRGEPAETRFKPVAAANAGMLAPNQLRFPEQEIPSGLRGVRACQWVEAEPLTGRTHQIRVHAAANGFPILGDTLYGGASFARVCLHAAELAFRHPATGRLMTFRAPADFDTDVRLALRSALIDPGETDAFRVVHGSSDHRRGIYVDKLGDFLLAESDAALTTGERTYLERLCRFFSLRGVYHKILTRRVRQSSDEASPRSAFGEAAPERFTVRENGVRFELSFNEGCSVGLFLDQRDNRRRLLTGHIAAGFPLVDPDFRAADSEFRVLNAFAYTCGFSVCAALAGARTTSLDLSKKYLEWGRRNFLLNGVDPAAHDFIFGDVFDWLRRLNRRKCRFDLILLDPPTFSRSKEHGVFRAGRDYEKLIAAALPLLRPNGVLFASTNAASWPPEDFLARAAAAVQSVDRRILKEQYVPQPPDFPVSRSEPAYLKSVWWRIQ